MFFLDDYLELPLSANPDLKMKCITSKSLTIINEILKNIF